LKDQWSPVLTLKSSLISLQSLLQDPVPNDPQDAEVAKHFLSDREGFNQTARFWTQTYCSKEGDEDEDIDTIDLYGIDRSLADNFVSMGFPQARVVEVLRRLGIKKLGDDAESTNNRILEELLRE
jgi:ubiquitin-conjugating enzyme (huntingtin interacting protein 2)